MSYVDLWDFFTIIRVVNTNFKIFKDNYKIYHFVILKIVILFYTCSNIFATYFETKRHCCACQHRGYIVYGPVAFVWFYILNNQFARTAMMSINTLGSLALKSHSTFVQLLSAGVCVIHAEKKMLEHASQHITSLHKTIYIYLTADEAVNGKFLNYWEGDCAGTNTDRAHKQAWWNISLPDLAVINKINLMFRKIASVVLNSRT